MRIEPLPRFKVFESTDTDESVDALNRFFGEKNFINQLSSASNLSSVSVGNLASSVLIRFRSTHEIHIERKDTTDHVFVHLPPIDGIMHVESGRKGEATSSTAHGIVVSMDEKTKAVVSGFNGRGLLIPRPALHQSLEALTGKPATGRIDFDMVLDSHGGSGSVIHSTIEMAVAQFEETRSPLGHPAVAARLEEFIIHALLHGQPHTHWEAIAGARQTATPKQVRRAEAYIQAHAGEAIRLAQIAEAAGCSVRALQLAFRAFRDTTPMAMLRQVRLARVHAELARAEPGSATVTDVAGKYGFFNAHRLVRDYRKSFCQLPSETLRFGRKHQAK